MGHGLEIRDGRAATEPATVRFGPMHAIIDNLRMGMAVPPQLRRGAEPDRRIENLSMNRDTMSWNQSRGK